MNCSVIHYGRVEDSLVQRSPVVCNEGRCSVVQLSLRHFAVQETESPSDVAKT